MEEFKVWQGPIEALGDDPRLFACWGAACGNCGLTEHSESQPSGWCGRCGAMTRVEQHTHRAAGPRWAVWNGVASGARAWGKLGVQ
jgi:hypothetical protein